MFRYEIVGDVRGKGLMIGIEMVEDKASKKPLNGVDMMKIWDKTKDSGVLIGQFFFQIYSIHISLIQKQCLMYTIFFLPPPQKKKTNILW